MNSEYGGYYDNSGNWTWIQGNGTNRYLISSNNSNPWSVKYQIQKFTADGTLDVEFILRNGTVVAGNSTTQSYGIVSGEYLSIEA